MVRRHTLDFFCSIPLITLGFFLGYGFRWPGWAILVFCLLWLLLIDLSLQMLGRKLRNAMAARLSLFVGGLIALALFLWLFGSWRPAT